MSSRRLWPLKLSKEHLRVASRNCLTAAATRIVLNGGGMRSHTGTVVSETSPTTVWCQWFLRALPLESNTTMWEKLGSQRLLNWLQEREKPPGAGYRWLRERCVGSQSGGVVSGVCLPLEQGPLEKGSRARPAYMRDWTTNGYIRRLMALPFLLHETIAATFDSLKPEAKTEPL